MAERPSAGDYIQVLKTTVPSMVDQIGELAKAELKPAAKHGGIGAGAFGGAAAVGMTVLKFLMLTFAFALSMMYHELAGFNPLTALTLGFLTTSVLGLIIVAVFALFGRSQVMKVKPPSATIAETRASLGAITDAIENGFVNAQQQRVPTDAIEITTAAAKPPKRSTDNWSE